MDGGVVCNHPAVHVDAELLRLYPDQSASRLMISLGTGMGPLPSMRRDPGTIHVIGPLLEIRTTHQEEREVNRAMTDRLGAGYKRIQPRFEHETPLDRVEDKYVRLFEAKFEEKLPDLEDIARLLLINDDNWRESGFDRQRSLADQQI